MWERLCRYLRGCGGVGEVVYRYMGGCVGI